VRVIGPARERRVTEHQVSFEVTGQNEDEITRAAHAKAKVYFDGRPYRLARISVRSQIEKLGEGTVQWYADVEAEAA
jgi:hypothetical protein